MYGNTIAGQWVSNPRMADGIFQAAKKNKNTGRQHCMIGSRGD